MKILIDYDSSWRNSFLDGNNDKELPKKGRNYIASIKGLSKAENFIEREVTKNTVMGVLSRLIGDQRKLYQSRSSSDYYFKDMEDSISFEDRCEITNEMTYLRNMNGNYDLSAFAGVVKSNDPAFNSDYSKALWSILFLELDELCDFIIDNKLTEKQFGLDPLSVCNQMEFVTKIKPVPDEGRIKEAVEIIKGKYEDAKCHNKKEKVMPYSLFYFAVKIQADQLSSSLDLSSVLSKQGKISGLCPSGISKREFMNKFSTGGRKRVWGNPYIKTEFVKGQGEVKHLMSKASGQLEIKIDIDKEKAKELKELIEDSGVNSFYLGKKGLAYVAKVKI